MSRLMSVVLNSRMEWRRGKSQAKVALIIDRIDAFGFRVRAMPIRTSVEMAIGGVDRNLHDEVRILIFARSDDQYRLFINLFRPPLRSVEVNAVHDELVLRAIVKLHGHQKLLPRRYRGQRNVFRRNAATGTFGSGDGSLNSNVHREVDRIPCL